MWMGTNIAGLEQTMIEHEQVAVHCSHEYLVTRWMAKMTSKVWSLPTAWLVRNFFTIYSENLCRSFVVNIRNPSHKLHSCCLPRDSGGTISEIQQSSPGLVTTEGSVTL